MHIYIRTLVSSPLLFFIFFFFHLLSLLFNFYFNEADLHTEAVKGDQVLFLGRTLLYEGPVDLSLPSLSFLCLILFFFSFLLLSPNLAYAHINIYTYIID